MFGKILNTIGNGDEANSLKQIKNLTVITLQTMLTQAAPKMIEDGCPVERKLEPSAVGGMEFSDEPGPSMEPIVRQGRESSIVNSYDAQNRGDIEFSNPGEFQETFSTTPIPSEARPAATIHLPGIMNLLTLCLFNKGYLMSKNSHFR